MFVLNSQKAIVRLSVVALLVGVFLMLEGCYYMQAIRGHTDLMGRRRPVADVIEDSASPEELKARLELVQTASKLLFSGYARREPRILMIQSPECKEGCWGPGGAETSCSYSV